MFSPFYFQILSRDGAKKVGPKLTCRYEADQKQLYPPLPMRNHARVHTCITVRACPFSHDSHTCVGSGAPVAGGPKHFRMHAPGGSDCEKGL